MNLPELPNHAGRLATGVRAGEIVYTADQLRSYAEEAVRMERERWNQIWLAGEVLSNCAFNLAQRDLGEFTALDIKALNESREAWDRTAVPAKE